MAYGADLSAKTLLTQLTDDVDFTPPVSDVSLPEFKIPGDRFGAMYQEITKLTAEDLTTKEIDGPGVFDVLMASYSTHLEKEYKGNRITGAEYTKAYIALAQGAMTTAVQFLLQRDSAFWTAQTAQIQAVTARIQHETAMAQLAAMQYEAHNAKATYALTKLKLAGEDLQYGIAKYNLEQTLPAQLANLQAQQKVLTEQGEAARAQTLSTRSDGAPVMGSLGKQIALYDQQITSYQRDSENKAARLFTDAWITMKTMDEGAPVPSMFSNPSLDVILTKIRDNNGFV